MAGRLEEAPRVEAKRYIRVKFRIELTMSVEKMKSSLLRLTLGQEAMSPRTHKLMPTISSIKTLNRNWGLAVTLNLHPLRKSPNGPRPPNDNDSSLSAPSSSPLLPFPPTNETLGFSSNFVIGRIDWVWD